MRQENRMQSDGNQVYRTMRCGVMALGLPAVLVGLAALGGARAAWASENPNPCTVNITSGIDELRNLGPGGFCSGGNASGVTPLACTADADCPIGQICGPGETNIQGGAK